MEPNSDVFSGLERPLAAEIGNSPLLTAIKTPVTYEW